LPSSGDLSYYHKEAVGLPGEVRKEHPVNPMVIKKRRDGLGGRTQRLVRWLLASFIIFILLEALVIAVSGDWGISMMEKIMALEFACVLIMTPAVAAGALSMDDALGNTDPLNMTVLSPWQIVSERLLAGVIAVTPVLLAMALASLPFVYEHIHVRGVASFLLVFWVTIVECVFFALSLGLVASLLARGTIASMGLSYGLSFMAFIGVALICSIPVLVGIVPIPRLGVLALSPALAFLGNLDASFDSLYSGGSFFTPYWIVVTLAYGGVICAIIAICVEIVAQYHGLTHDGAAKPRD
jgi:hypothetical protein